MVSRNALIVVLVIVTLGLIGPISFIAQNAAKNDTLPTTVSATPIPQPIQLSQVLEYTADVTAEIDEVYPVLVAVLATNMTQPELYAELGNLSNATLQSLEPGEYYTASFMLENAEDRGLLLTQLMFSNVTIIEYAMPAEITLPSSYTAYRGTAPHYTHTQPL